MVPGGCCAFRVGWVSLWVQRLVGEWRVAWRHEDAVATATVDLAAVMPSQLPCQRFVGQEGLHDFQVRPAMPDRPVVVRPAMTLRLLPDSTTGFHVGVPVWLRVEVLNDRREPVALTAAPTQPLSNSWFGSVTEGELCYALRTRARLASEALTEPEQGRALCALQVRNESRQPFDFDRLCLRTEQLGIYSQGLRLWTNGAMALFRGHDAPARLTYAAGSPTEAAGATLLSPARQPIHAEGLTGRVFGSLKALGGFE